MTQRDYLTVTTLTNYLKRKFDADPYLGRVYLTGEISNFKSRPNAHQYFSLKDDKAKISAVMFKSAFSQLKFQPEEGMKVLLIGRVSLYEVTGGYQIYVEHMEPDGVGALYQAFEKLRRKLEAEGLFQEKHKQSLPSFPRKIGIVTSSSGAVIKDIITTVKRRYPIAQLVLYPTLVQGDKAAPDIVEQLKRADQSGEYDVLIVGRGGGSIEDLWPFNSEEVARAIFESRTPVISSVGHETDTTIADLVADVRAATPTAAAELATPKLSDELLKIQEKRQRLCYAFGHLVKSKKTAHDRVMDSFVFRQPKRLYEAFFMQLDQLNRRLEQRMTQQIQQGDKAFNGLRQRLLHSSPAEMVTQKQQQLTYYNKQLRLLMVHQLQQKRNHFDNQVAALDMLSPLKTMARGYSYVTKDEKIVSSVSELNEKDTLSLHMSDGELEVTVTNTLRKEKS